MSAEEDLSNASRDNLLKIAAKLTQVALTNPALYDELVALQQTHPDSAAALSMRRMLRLIKEGTAR